MGMVDGIVAVAIVGATIVATQTYIASATKMQAKLDVTQNNELVRQYLRKNAECSRTFTAINPADCGVTNRYIDVYDRSGSVMVKSDGSSRIGVYKVRASCANPDSISFETIRMADLAGGADARVIAKNPWTRNDETWFDPFKGVPAMFNGGAGRGLVKFEDIPGVHERMIVDDSPTRDLPSGVNGFLWSNYGVRFIARKGGQMAIAKVIQAEDETPVSFEAWMSVLCHGRPNHNRLCNGGNAGRWILSTTEATDTSDGIEFDIEYATPVKNLNFDLADFDGGENWSFTLFGADGRPMVVKEFDSRNGYGNNTGNNALTPIPLSHNGQLITKVRARGEKSIRIFGFGFDNFETGIYNCVNE